MNTNSVTEIKMIDVVDQSVALASQSLYVRV